MSVPERLFPVFDPHPVRLANLSPGMPVSFLDGRTWRPGKVQQVTRTRAYVLHVDPRGRSRLVKVPAEGLRMGW